MNDTLDQTLCERYPKIFANRYQDPQTTAMCWGFECGDGWFNLIDRLCGTIQNHIDWRDREVTRAKTFNLALTRAIDGDRADMIRYYLPSTPEYSTVPQWVQDWIDKAVDKKEFAVVPPAVPQVVAIQVKEKFGGLRFYYCGGDEYIRGVSALAESLSYVTCEVCGSSGTRNDGGWLTVRCEQHKED